LSRNVGHIKKEWVTLGNNVQEFIAMCRRRRCYFTSKRRRCNKVKNCVYSGKLCMEFVNSTVCVSELAIGVKVIQGGDLEVD